MTETTDNVVDFKTKETKEKRNKFVDRWGPDVARIGFTMIPSLLLKAQHRLGLSPTQLVVLLQIADHWWTADDHPWPGKQLLSDKIGIKKRQVQRVVADLEKRGYITRNERVGTHGGTVSNEYDLRPLAAKLQALAPEFQKVEDETKEKRRAVVRRGFRRPDKTPK